MFKAKGPVETHQIQFIFAPNMDYNQHELLIRSMSSSPSFVPAWVLAGTWWDRCKCSSSCSLQLAPSAPRSRSSHLGGPKKTGSWKTYHLRGGERKGWRDESTVMGPTDKMIHTQAQRAGSSGPSHNERLMTSLFLLPSWGIYIVPTVAPTRLTLMTNNSC